jgi:hypothetical protein
MLTECCGSVEGGREDGANRVCDWHTRRDVRRGGGMNGVEAVGPLATGWAEKSVAHGPPATAQITS